MGRNNQLATTYDLFIIGEQLRCQMASVGLIKDNRHHLRKHRQCFVAKDAIDWILKMHHVDSRSEAVEAMTILQEFNVIHHVTDDQEFKDKNLLFRFTKDDETYKTDRELQTFYRALDIYDKIKQKGRDVLRDVYFKGNLHSNVFYGEDLVDFLLEWEDTLDRDDVVEELQDLLDRNVIKQLSDDCHFVDDKIVYTFNIDFYKSCMLYDILEVADRLNTLPIKTSPDVNRVGEASKIQDYLSHTQNIRIYQLYSDKVGFGMTIRGYSPCYIHHLEPLGPAAKAGLKVGQAVISVNGQSVYKMDHKRVGLMIAQSDNGRTSLHIGVRLHNRRN